MNRILLLEDDPDSAEITKTHLTYAGYAPSIARCLSEADQLLQEQEFDLLLLDMMLPDGSGIQLCAKLRANGHTGPIIFITCIDEGDMMVDAFEKGADDYVVKPVNYETLVARIKAHLRREDILQTKKTQKNETVQKIGDFTLDKVRRQLTRGNVVVELSSIEYSLLLFMLENADKLLLYDELYRHVWVNESLGDVRTVMVHISNLRKKIDPDKTGIIQTVRGAGYVFSNL